jgi:malate synthase
MVETAELSGVVVRGPIKAGNEKILTPEAVAFAAELERKFGTEPRRLLSRRAELQKRLGEGPGRNAARGRRWP